MRNAKIAEINKAFIVLTQKIFLSDQGWEAGEDGIPSWEYCGMQQHIPNYPSKKEINIIHFL